MSNTSKKTSSSKAVPLPQAAAVEDAEDPIIVGGGTIPPRLATEAAQRALQIIIDGANWTWTDVGDTRTITIHNLASDPWIITPTDKEGNFAIKRRLMQHRKVALKGFHVHDSRDLEPEADGNPAAAKEVKIEYGPI